MNRQRKIDEELWEDGNDDLSSDHVVERFFSQHERADAHEPVRRPGARSKRRELPPPERDN
jgi:hypothetical protein